MAFWKRWFEPPRQLVFLFLAVALLLVGVLFWSGWQLVRQDRELAAQRLLERQESVADLAVAALQKSLSQAEEQVTSLAALPLDELRRKAVSQAAAIPEDSALILLHGGEVEVWPERRLAFYPVVAKASEPPASLFAEAENLEFRQPDYPKAIAALRELARSPDPRVRTAALMRIARIDRKQGRWAEALAVYEEMATAGDAHVEGLPTDLVIGQARLAVLARMDRSEAAQKEATALLDRLQKRRWPLTRGAYEFYVAEAQKALGRTGETVDTSGAIELASAVESLYQDLADEPRPGGRAIFREGSTAMLALWRSAGERMIAVVLGPRWPEAQWAAGLGSKPFTQDVTIGLTDLGGRFVVGHQVGQGAPQSVRMASVTHLPWNVHAVTRDAEAALASLEMRRRLIVAVLAVIAVLTLAGSYLVGRAVTRELAVSRMQSDFVSAVSHEFRTPLTSLCLLTEHLVSGRVAGEGDRDEYYGILSRESQRLRRLVEGLLNFGRMEAGAMQYRFETIDPAELVQEVAGEFQRDMESSGHRVEVCANGDAPLVHADRAALACAVWNLLDNAVKYSPECQTVWADVGREDGRAAIRVRDRGLGIPVSEQRRVFEKFTRGAAAREAGIRGTGVGLAMVRHIAAAHGGEIKLESKPGEGSAFTLLLPAVSRT